MISEALLDRLTQEICKDGGFINEPSAIRDTLKKFLADVEFTHAQDPAMNFNFYCGLKAGDGIVASSSRFESAKPTCPDCRKGMREAYLTQARVLTEWTDGLA